MGMEAPIIEVKERRRTRRRRTDANVGLREIGAHRVATRLLDISRYGFRVAAERLTPDSSVWLKLADCEPQLARVVWSDAQASGCVFAEPLDQTIYRTALRTAGIETTIIA
jgi:hypothetical protein